MNKFEPVFKFSDETSVIHHNKPERPSTESSKVYIIGPGGYPNLKCALDQIYKDIGFCQPTDRDSDHESSDDDSGYKRRKRSNSGDNDYEGRNNIHRDRNMDNNYENQDHNNTNEFAPNTNNNILPIDILIHAGTYELPLLNNSLSLNLSSILGASGQPNVILRGNTISRGNKNYSGIIFANCRYTLRAEERNTETFNNCRFNDKFSFYGKQGMVNFIRCKFCYDRLSDILLSSKYNMIVSIDNCEFNCNRYKDCVSIFNFAGSSDKPNRINNTTFNIRAICGSETHSRRYYPLQLNSSQPLEITNSVFNVDAKYTEIVIIGTPNKCDSLTLKATNVNVTNRDPSNIFVSFIGGLWSRSRIYDQFGSIYLSRMTFNSVRILSFDSGECCHERLCAVKEKCNHRDLDYGGRDQTITITHSDIFLYTPSGRIVTAMVNIEGVPASNWRINFLTNNVFINNINLPFNIDGINSLILNLTGTSMINVGGMDAGTNNGTNNGANNGANNSNPNSWLVVNNVTGTSTIIIPPSTSINGMNNNVSTNVPGNVVVVTGNGF